MQLKFNPFISKIKLEFQMQINKSSNFYFFIFFRFSYSLVIIRQFSFKSLVKSLQKSHKLPHRNVLKNRKQIAYKAHKFESSAWIFGVVMRRFPLKWALKNILRNFEIFFLERYPIESIISTVESDKNILIQCSSVKTISEQG